MIWCLTRIKSWCLEFTFWVPKQMSVCIFIISALPRYKKEIKVACNVFLNVGEDKGDGKYWKGRKKKQQLGIQKTFHKHHNPRLAFLELASTGLSFLAAGARTEHPIREARHPSQTAQVFLVLKPASLPPRGSSTSGGAQLKPGYALLWGRARWNEWCIFRSASSDLTVRNWSWFGITFLFCNNL